VQLDLRPLTPHIGAEVCSASTARATSTTTSSRAIRAAWLEHLVLFFPGQSLDDDRQIAFASRFGEVTEVSSVEANDAASARRCSRSTASRTARTSAHRRDVHVVAADGIDAAGRGATWRSAATPCGPTRGAAYDALAEPLQRFWRQPLTAIHFDEYYAAVRGRRGWERVGTARSSNGSGRCSTRSCGCIPRPVAATCS